MTAWPYMTLYTETREIKDSLLCYAATWEDYFDDCYSLETERTWIIINPFEKDNTSYMLSNITNSTDTDPIEGASSVLGFIF